MCTNMRSVWNPYSRKKILVRCGKCAACKQEQAFKRAVRIRNNVMSGQIALFVTLTYTNDFVPYVRLSDLQSDSVDLPVYRNADIRYIFDRHSNKTSIKKIYGTKIIANIDKSQIVDRSIYDYDSDGNKIPMYKHLVGLSSDCVGVCWFPDLQNFYKRLRQILIRDFSYEKKFSYFTCTEYGGDTYRPHSHLLLFINRDDETTFRSAVLKAWSYADRRRTAKFIEVARDAANYVSSYVNSNISLRSLMSNDFFRQKHSTSKLFGVGLDCFSLCKILEKIDNRNLFYNCEQKFDGKSLVSSLPIPKYILHRYFPQCKGFNRLSSFELRSILLDPQKVGFILNDYKGIVNRTDNLIYHFSPKESYQIYIRLENCFKRFHSETGLSRFDYADYYFRCWNLYYSSTMRFMHELFQQLDGNYQHFYDNANDLVFGFVHSDLDISNLCIDPNKRPDIVQKTDKMRSLYSRMNKQRKVTNYVLNQIYSNF